MGIALPQTAVLVALAVTGCANTPSDEPSIPIWWSPLLELESLDAIDDRLDRRFPDDEFYRFNPPDSLTGETAFVRSCRDALRVMPAPVYADYDAGSPLNPGTAVEFFYHCILLTKLKSAVPSKASHLPTLMPDLSLFEQLPAFTKGFGSHFDFCVTAGISNAGRSWGDLIAMNHLRPDRNRWDPNDDVVTGIEAILARRHRWKDLAHKTAEALAIEFYESLRDPANGRYHRLWLKVQNLNYVLYPLARADFDRDGYEDMVLLVFWVAGGTSYFSHLQVFTRTQPGGLLSVINLDEINELNFQGRPCE